ncbi:hypothetical protein ACP70R_013076 [Stipagrostis hirtigluma subsp. patula]
MAMAAASMEVEQDLPGFRFHPTEEELLDFYLARVARGKKLHFDIIGTLNIYRHDPWDLPGMAKIGEREWYFFVPRDRKSGNGGRPNRTTERGFWKATGSDRAIRSSADAKRVIGLKKTLVFYRGRAPRGTKTDWVMNEYRLPELDAGRAAPAPPKEEMVLCKIYRKATPLKELEQRASAMEEMQRRGCVDYAVTASMVRAASAGDDYLSSDDVHDMDSLLLPSSSSSAPSGGSSSGAPNEPKREADAATVTVASTSLANAANMYGMQLPAARQAALDPPSLQLPAARFDLPSLQLQIPANHGVQDWMQDPFLTQLRSPWQDLSPLAHLLY